MQDANDKAKARRIDPRTLPPLDQNQRYSIPETNAYLRQSNAKTYEDIGAGLLEIIKDGRRTYVTGRAIAARSRVEAAA